MGRYRSQANKDWAAQYRESPTSPDNVRLPENLCVRRATVNTSEGPRDVYVDPTQRVRKVIGIGGTKMPKDFRGKFKVDGHTVVVFPSLPGPKPRNRKSGKKTLTIQGRKYGAHRMFFLLKNGRLIPTGRVHQYCIEKRRSARKAGSDPKDVTLSGLRRRGW
jgi:hypothetical protein